MIGLLRPERNGPPHSTFCTKWHRARLSPRIETRRHQGPLSWSEHIAASQRRSNRCRFSRPIHAALTSGALRRSWRYSATNSMAA